MCAGWEHEESAVSDSKAKRGRTRVERMPRRHELNGRGGGGDVKASSVVLRHLPPRPLSRFMRRLVSRPSHAVAKSHPSPPHAVNHGRLGKKKSSSRAHPPISRHSSHLCVSRHATIRLCFASARSLPSSSLPLSTIALSICAVTRSTDTRCGRGKRGGVDASCRCDNEVSQA